MQSLSEARWRYGTPLRYRTYRRYAFLLIITTLIIFLFRHLPTSPRLTEKNDRRAAGVLPTTSEADVEEAPPQYFRPSAFREHPDVEYEAKILAALKDIERMARKTSGDGAKETIWQVMLKDGWDITTNARGPDSISFEQRNPEWAYQLVTNDWAVSFLTTIFSTVPDLLTLYNSYPYDVLRADLIRYLLLWYHGGYYADMDVFPARSIKSCPSLTPLFSDPSQSKSDLSDRDHPNVSLVVGIELDESTASASQIRYWGWVRRYGLIQYTMYAPQRFSPVLRETIVRALAHSKRLYDKRSLANFLSFRFFGRPWYSQEQVMEVTGPTIFTDTVLDVLSDTLPPTHALVATSVWADSAAGELSIASSSSFSSSNGIGPETQKRVTWAPIHKLETPLWINASEAAPEHEMGGLGILPISVWGNGQRHSGSEGFGSAHACVNHRFQGSWKKGWKEYLFG